MAKAKKLPSGSWRAQVYDYTDENGKRHYASFTAEGKKEAEYMAAEFALNKKNRYRSEKTFGQALEDYISIREPIVSPRTILNYRRMQRTYMKPLEKIKIADITQEVIQNFVNKDATVHSPKTVRDNHGLISAVLKQERPDFALNTVLPKLIRPDLCIPEDNDIKQLIAASKGSDMELPILLAAFGPMRRGEICALDTSNIRGNVVHVCRNMVLNQNNQWVIKEPKSFAGDRFIEYPDFVAEKWADFSGPITRLTPDNLSNRFSRLLKSANIPHFRFHDLRHYCASIQHALGVPDAYIMKRGGWENDGVLKNIYRHALNQEACQMNRLTNDYFNKMQHEMQHEKIKP